MKFITIVLKGISQVMLQSNALTGLLFLLAIFWNSWMQGIAALIGTISGTLISYAFKAEKENVQNGLYGFNGCLVGIAMIVFLGFNVGTLAMVIAGASISSLVMYRMIKWRWRPLTFPFVVVTWVFLLVMAALGQFSVSTPDSSGELDVFSAITMGLGQVFFQDNIISGILILMGLLLCSIRLAAHATAASVMGLLIALAFGLPLYWLNLGIYGFNAVLCAIAFTGSGKRTWYFILISVLLSIAIAEGFLRLQLIPLTAPFVFATWATHLLRKN